MVSICQTSANIYLRNCSSRETIFEIPVKYFLQHKTNLSNYNSILTQTLLCYVMFCYVEFIYRRNLQFPNDYTIASLEANQNRPKIKNYVNK